MNKASITTSITTTVDTQGIYICIDHDVPTPLPGVP
jgi:hypothetical protein